MLGNKMFLAGGQVLAPFADFSPGCVYRLQPGCISRGCFPEFGSLLAAFNQCRVKPFDFDL